MANTWMVRAGRGSKNVEEFLSHGVVALGDDRLGKLSSSMKKDDLLRLYAEKYPEMKEGARQVWTGQIMRLLTEIKIGDQVITSDRDRRLYFIGTITSDYEWAQKLVEKKPHVRRVKWTHQVQRDLLSVPTRNTLGAIQTLFKLNPDVVKDLQAHAAPFGSDLITVDKPVAVADEGEEAAAEVREEMFEKADGFVEDAIMELDWKQMQDLVAGILRAMGYKTSVSEVGPDRGVDIFASPDGLGLQEPRIFVEVKHRPQSPIGADKVRSFLGGRKAGDKCLYVSTGSFAKEARYEADRASVPTTLIDLQELRKLLVEYYEKLDAETRALVPLKRLYWPLV